MVRAAWARASYERRCNLTESHAIHRWEMLRDRLPAVALVLTHPQGPCRRAEREPVPRLVHVERVAIGEIVGVLLRQSLREHLEAFPPIPRARHDDPALHRDALLVAHARHEPGGVRVVGMHRDREAEPRGLDRGDLLPRRRAVGGAEYAVVVLDPKGIGLGPTLDQVVRILNVGIILTLGRHVRRAHALGTAFPGRTAVPGHPHATTRDSDRHVARIARIHADRMEAGQLGAAAEPFSSLGMAPQRLDQLPRRPVVGEEVHARDRPARARSSLAALERENALAGGDVEPVAHPPERACITQTSPSVGTASLRCARSWICRPLTNTTMWRRTAP